MAVKQIAIEDVKALGWTYEPIAVRIVTFDCYGRGCSDIRFLASSVIREYNRLVRHGYCVGLVDCGENWPGNKTVTEVSAQICAKRAERLAA